MHLTCADWGECRAVREVSKNNDSLLLQIDFMAPWCGKCRMLAPHVEALQAANPGIKFFKYDTSKDGLDSLAQEIGVSALPVFRFYKDGKEVVDSVVGYKKKPVQDAVEKLASL